MKKILVGLLLCTMQLVSSSEQKSQNQKSNNQQRLSELLDESELITGGLMYEGTLEGFEIFENDIVNDVRCKLEKIAKLRQLTIDDSNIQIHVECEVTPHYTVEYFVTGQYQCDIYHPVNNSCGSCWFTMKVRETRGIHNCDVLSQLKSKYEARPSSSSSSFSDCKKHGKEVSSVVGELSIQYQFHPQSHSLDAWTLQDGNDATIDVNNLRYRDRSKSDEVMDYVKNKDAISALIISQLSMRIKKVEDEHRAACTRASEEFEEFLQKKAAQENIEKYKN